MFHLLIQRKFFLSRRNVLNESDKKSLAADTHRTMSLKESEATIDLNKSRQLFSL